jgi:hypothetical protein
MHTALLGTITSYLAGSQASEDTEDLQGLAEGAWPLIPQSLINAWVEGIPQR